VGHPNDMTFGAPTRSSDNEFHYRYPNGNWPGNAGNASGAGSTDSTSAPSGSASGGAFTPLLDINFDGLSNGASISADTSGTVGKRFDYWGSFSSNSYGTRAQTAVKRAGKTSAAELRIQGGTTGRAGDGSPTANGNFGGGFIFPSAVRTSQGQDLYVGMWLNFPTGFSFATDTGFLKFIRFTQENASGTENGGKLEQHIVNGGLGSATYGSQSYSGGISANTQIGWNLASEITPNDQPDTVRITDRVFPADSNWHQFCVQVRAHATPANAIRRLWIDGQLAYERTGGNSNHYHNASGWHTDSMSAAGHTDEPTLADSAGALSGMMLFTYWNGNASQDQSCYVQRIIFHKNSAQLNGTDEFGNKFIDMSAF
jgi:hypothetical protein